MLSLERSRESLTKKSGVYSNTAPPCMKKFQDVGSDIKVATVKDPFGNVFGVIENPHFKL